MSMKLFEGGDTIDQVCGLEMQIQKYLNNNNRKYQNAHFKQKQVERNSQIHDYLHQNVTKNQVHR